MNELQNKLEGKIQQCARDDLFKKLQTEVSNLKAAQQEQELRLGTAQITNSDSTNMSEKTQELLRQQLVKMMETNKQSLGLQIDAQKTNLDFQMQSQEQDFKNKLISLENKLNKAIAERVTISGPIHGPGAEIHSPTNSQQQVVP